jgi:hypothetical protein
MSSVLYAGAEATRFSHDPITHEPTLDEIFADPLVGLILRRDRLTAGSVRAQLDRERHRLAGPAGAPALRHAA